MPYPSTHKSQTRDRILQSAARLFSWQGFDKVSIDMVMADAGLTRGAFYSHFSDKSALYAEAIAYAARHSQLAKYVPELPAAKGLQMLVEAYLSHEHIGEESFPCPLAFLATDVSQRDPQVRNTYTRVYQGMVTRIGKLLPGQSDRQQRLAATAMMIGGVAIARALDDPATKDELLVACRKFALELLVAEESGDGLSCE
jgi:TetR/AcrR family transcriptional repressor of nem operon